ncbi:MAG: hypothetical protein CEO12_686 [Parcubacteria group bacterium Gr01-1014_46]|nr:MAG: hypothetical protein CEO12_686 [Parcubacteria group bacterium Gr01-1014_46]
MIIIGITGQPSSGKDTVANYLASLGFLHVSTSDLIRQEMREQGLPTDRPTMHDFVAERRKERGQGYLAELAVQKIKGDAVVSGLRNTAEIEILRNSFGDKFVLVAVEAPLETRYRWVVGRRRDIIDLTFEQFKAEEEAEKNANEGAFQVDAIIAMADKLILNDGTKEELLKKVDEVMKSITG